MCIKTYLPLKMFGTVLRAFRLLLLLNVTRSAIDKMCVNHHFMIYG